MEKVTQKLPINWHKNTQTAISQTELMGRYRPMEKEMPKSGKHKTE
jgi:hypothetical protein